MEYLSKITDEDVDKSINKRGQVAATQTDSHAVVPFQRDEILTVEDRIQSEMWKALSSQKSDESLRGLYARYDRQAQDRATGKAQQTWEFDGVMPSRAEGLDEMIKRFGAKPGQQEIAVQIEGREEVVQTTVYEA